jgi:hypothetical protein
MISVYVKCRTFNVKVDGTHCIITILFYEVKQNEIVFKVSRRMVKHTCATREFPLNNIFKFTPYLTEITLNSHCIYQASNVG